MGEGIDGPPYAACPLPGGGIVVGGTFATLGGAPASRVALWSGSAWHALGTGVRHSVFPSLAVVCAIAALPGDHVVVGGLFDQAGGVAANNVARWDGTQWSPLGAGFADGVAALAVLPGGDAVAASPAIGASVYPCQVARWDGANWSALGANFGGGVVFTLVVLPGGDLVAGGSFTQVGGVVANHIARWDGVSWSAVGAGLPGVVQALAVLPNGELIAGMFALGVARWDGTAWSGLGAGTSGSVSELATLPNGDLVAGGNDLVAVGVGGAQRLARWNGTNWSTIGAPANLLPMACAVSANGDLFVGGHLGRPYLARVVPTCPASAAPHGSGCAGAGGANALAAASLPWLGGTFVGAATGLASNSLAIGVFGFQPIAVPLSVLHPQGLPGCDALVSPDLLGLWPVVAGTASTWLAIPSTTTLVGAACYHQVVAVEPGVGSSVAALSSTNALQLVLGTY